MNAKVSYCLWWRLLLLLAAAGPAAAESTLTGQLHLLLSPSMENSDSTCSDGRDNDGDGQTDCLDSDCLATAICENSCTNGLLDFPEYWVDCGGGCGACPTCVDGVQNGDERGVDCGGSCISCDAQGEGQIVDITDSAAYGYPFRMYLPPGYTHSGSFPLLIFLHGAGERGSDLDKVAVHGPLKHVSAVWWNYDFVVIAPQVDSGGWWNRNLVRRLYDTVKETYSGIDQRRVYITGLSMGGFGVNDIMKNSDNDWVTANAEICGQVVTDQSACNYAKTPSWAFACDYDPTVGYAWSISPWAKILHGEHPTYSCGNDSPNPRIKISLFDCSSHNSWARVYDPHGSSSAYLLSTDRDVTTGHQFAYGLVNNAPPIYDWFLHTEKQP